MAIESLLAESSAGTSEPVPAILDSSVLIDFFEQHGRNLPWRGTGATPWRVLVSEVMLQQTPVARVLPVFDQWVQRWPTPQALAMEAPAEILRTWGRLGYPRRALRLREAAVRIVESFDGNVPDDLVALLSLPGVGSYTARAVLAFGFNRRSPVVDTNVRRVLSRTVRGVDDPGPATLADLRLLEPLLPVEADTSARFSAALMELGALVCTAAAPRCASCPLRTGCAWFSAGRPTSTVVRRSQQWQGSDRQVRGRILAALRDAHEPLPASSIVPPDCDEVQGTRCLNSLLADGLATRSDAGYTLPLAVAAQTS
jgi:A/G-specific adenine glycosylase